MEGLEKERDFFEEFGLEVQAGEVAVGATYPIYGMITKFISDAPGDVEVELNFNIKAKLDVKDEGGIQTLKDRLFETGIFVSTVVAKEPCVNVICKTVVYGRKQEFHA